MLNYLFEKSKAISLVVGFLIAVLGSIWSFLVMERLNENMRQLSDTKADLRRQVESLKNLSSDYFIANQQGDLIFMLALQEHVRKDVASLVYQGNLLDRATPVRNLIGELAIAKQLDYRQTYNAYGKLNDATRANLSFENFTRLKQAEKAVLLKCEERIPLLLDQLFQLEKAINANDALQKKNSQLGLIASILGGLILLCTNLIAIHREEKT